jgi:transposase InsO family protein
MSRVWECFDNSPMEAFWSRLKSEMYYLNKFKTYAELEIAVEEYIEYYNKKRCQVKLKGMTPMEYRDYLKKINV